MELKPRSPVEHTHAKVTGCPGCMSRFGTIAATANEIEHVLSGEFAEAAVLVQLVFTLNKHLDRIATVLENTNK